MHSTLVFLFGFAILGAASPLAGVASNSTSPPYNIVTVNVANKTLAGQNTNSTMSLSAAAAQDDPPANPPSINDLPPCYVPCVKDGIEKETQCTLEDVACICENKTKIGKAAKDCVVEKCGLNTAIKLVGPAVKKLCDMDDDDMETESWEEGWMRVLGQE